MFAPLSECMALCERLGDTHLLGRALLRFGRAEAALAHYDSSRAALEHSFNLFQKINSGMVGSANWLLGELALGTGQWTEAYRLLKESVAVLRETGARGVYGMPIAELGLAALRLGYPDRARCLLSEALRIAVSVGNFEAPICVLPFVALYIAEKGELEHAVELVALANRYPFIANSTLWQDIAGKPIAALAAPLPPEVTAAAQERGRRRDLWDTIRELQTAPEFNQN